MLSFSSAGGKIGTAPKSSTALEHSFACSFLRQTARGAVICSMSRSGNVSENAAIESFFSSLKTERIERKIYRTRNEARAGVFDYIERF
jgi:hypothetical protein